MSAGPGLGRGILIKGRWAEAGAVRKEFRYARRTFTLPLDLPDWFLAPPAVRTFNLLNYVKHGSSVRRALVHPAVFFYPLDALLSWNRLYGKRGFTQYQCVMPVRGSLERQRRLLQMVAERGGAFLCVVKDCGAEGKGMLSFPRPGISFALDMPIRPAMQELVDTLNELVVSEGGRIYLAKDAFTRPEHFRAMEPRLRQWGEVRAEWDPEGRLRSALSRRILGGEP
jgi:FAD/FMN-containing dehydrogenase